MYYCQILSIKLFVTLLGWLLTCTNIQALPLMSDGLQTCYLSGIPEQLSCGVFTTPENPQNPNGRQLQIHFALLPAIKNTRPSNAILAIAGGPGQSAIDNAAFFNQILYKVRQFQDVILIDQRGTGRSHPLNCEFLSSEQSMATNDDVPITSLTRTCLAQQDADVSQYTSQQAVDDFEAIRNYLGYQKLDLYGISYGTRVAQLYMRRYPDAINSVILDGVVPMQQNLMQVTPSLTRALEKLFSDCQQQPSCAQQFPRLKEVLTNLVDKLTQAPIKTQLAEPTSGEITAFTLTLDKLWGTIRLGLYSASTRTLLPYAIEQANQGNYQPLLGLYSLTFDNANIAMGMQASVICSEAMPFINASSVIDSPYNHIGESMVNNFKKICKVWQVPAVDDAFHKPVKSDIPTLLLSGDLDPATPPSMAEQTKSQLTHSKHIILPYASHGTAKFPCVQNQIAKLVRNQSVSQIDDSCTLLDTGKQFFLNANTMEKLPIEELR